LVDPARSGDTISTLNMFRLLDTRRTVAEPGDVAWKGWVKRARSDEHTGIDNPRGRTRHAHDEPDSHNTQTHEYEGVPFSHAITVPRHRYR
jgi:hypothetical protein